MQIVEISDKDFDEFKSDLDAFLNKVNEESVIVHVAIFYDRFSEVHKGIICYYE